MSVDEWNVWYQTRFNEVDKEPLLTGEWNEAPRLIEDEYGVTDAVVVGSLLNSLLRHGDRVSMANLAQLVNVIAPIRSEPGGPAWRQTTFHPFERTARFARGEILSVDVSGAPLVDTQKYGAVPVVDAAATRDGDDVVLFLVNRSTTDELALSVEIPDVAALALVDAETLTVPDGLDRHASNTAAEPSRVGLVPLAGVEVSSGAEDSSGAEVSSTVAVTLPALSWSIIRLAATAAPATLPAAPLSAATSAAASSASSPSDVSDATTSSLGDTRA
jgi:alpha-N-arabinofuranosidase